MEQKNAHSAQEWETLKPLVEEQRYREVLPQLDQAGQKIVWRRRNDRSFQKMSGITGAKGRVENSPASRGGANATDRIGHAGYRAAGGRVGEQGDRMSVRHVRAGDEVRWRRRLAR
jgi:hypothetical protein